MQDFGTKADDTAGPAGQLSAAEFNNLATELENAVLRGGLALSGASVVQLATSLFLHGAKSSSFQDSGVANAYVATPVTGSGGVFLPNDYAAMNGASVNFIASNSNSGNCTLNIGQTTGALLGSKKILTRTSTEVPAGRIRAGDVIELRYNPTLDSGNGAWRIVGGGPDLIEAFPKRTFLANDYIRIPDVPGGLIINWGTLNSSAVGATTVTLPFAFSATGLRVYACPQDTGLPNTAAGVIVSNTQISISAWEGSESPMPRTVTSVGWMAIGY